MANTKLTRTPSSVGNSKTWTYSMWIKLGKTDTEYVLFHNFGSSNTSEVYAKIGGSSGVIEFALRYSGTYEGRLITNRLFRDTSAWYHLVFVCDTTSATATNRQRIYVNGVEETSFSTDTQIAQNAGTVFNQAHEHTIGSYGSGNYFDGVMSHIHMTDGTAYTASTFGSTDATTGEWKINTSPSVTYGTNGFFILKDGNSVTDQSGNSNNYAVAGGTLTNTEDCPSNVFATFNPLSSNNPTLSGGSLIATASGGYRYALSTIAPTTGKYYAEFKLTTDSGYTNFGVENISKGSFFSQYNTNSYIGDANSGVAYQPGSSSLYHNGSSSGSYGSAVSGDIIGIAMDLDNGFIYWSKNGTFLNSGVPTSAGTGTGGYAISNIANSSGGNTYAMGVSLANTGGGRSISANFVNGYFGTTAISSEGSNASGIGKFEYDVPAGYTALSTKGLNE